MRVEQVPTSQAAGASDTVRLVLSSRGDGEIERCGCPKNPAGGLARRRTLLDQLRADGTVFVFEAGDSLAKLHAAPTERTRAKATLITQEWSLGGIDGVALGAADWGLGAADIHTMVADLPVVAANLVCGKKRPYPAARVVQRDGRTIGVVGLTLGEVEGCIITDPATAARQAHALLPDVDVTVLLWPARGEAAHQAGLDGLPFDFVVDASGRFGKADQPFWAGTTWLVGAGIMTKAFAQVDLHFKPGAKGFFPDGFAADTTAQSARLDQKQSALDRRVAQDAPAYKSQAAALSSRRKTLEARTAAFGDGLVHQMRSKTVRLTDDVEDHAETKQRVERVKATFGQSGTAVSPSELISRRLVGPDDSLWAGAQACSSCHVEQWSQWQRTPHARAMQALLRTANHNDDSCFGCHVTGAAQGGDPAYEVVVTEPAAIGGMIQVQCEACHGPSAHHVADPTSLPVRKPEAGVCQGCHDGVRDEGAFDYNSYLPKISH